MSLRGSHSALKLNFAEAKVGLFRRSFDRAVKFCRILELIKRGDFRNFTHKVRAVKFKLKPIPPIFAARVFKLVKLNRLRFKFNPKREIPAVLDPARTAQQHDISLILRQIGFKRGAQK